MEKSDQVPVRIKPNNDYIRRTNEAIMESEKLANNRKKFLFELIDSLLKITKHDPIERKKEESSIV